MKESRVLLVTHLAFAFVVGCLVTFFGSRDMAIGFTVGAAISLVNLVGLSFVWGRLLAKKSFALPIGVVVSKFALSLGVIFWATRPSNSIPVVGLLLGLGVIVPAVVAGALVAQRNIESSAKQTDQS